MTETKFTNAVPDGHDHRELKPDGQQLAYVVLSDEERAKGFVRPYRDSYVHVGVNPKMDGAVILEYGTSEVGKACGALTKMGRSIAETYARDPSFYGGTFCVGCRKHLPLAEFVWDGTTEQVGS